MEVFGPGGTGLRVWGRKTQWVLLFLIAMALGAVIWAAWDFRVVIKEFSWRIEEMTRSNRVQVCLLMLESVAEREKYYTWCVQNDTQYRIPPKPR